jgi:hypothetical protein
MAERERKARGASHYRIVLAAGLVSTALALGLVYLTTVHHISVLAWYAHGGGPLGAMMVGFIASIGYALGSRYTGVRMTKVMIGAIIGLHAASYVGGQYVESFAIGVVHKNARPVHAGEEKPDSRDLEAEDTRPGEPVEGYRRPWHRGLMSLGECLGLIAGGLVLPLGLLRVPYCKRCKMYLKRSKLGVFPAGGLNRAGRKGKREPEAPEDPDAPPTGLALVHDLVDLAREGDTATFESAIAAYGVSASKARERKRWITLILYRCPRCNIGFLRAAGYAKSSKEKSGKVVGQWRIEPDVVEALARRA